MAAKAFLSVPLVTALLLTAALVAYWLSPWFAVALSGMAVTVMLMEFLFYKQFMDVLFPKRTSYNVLGVQKPSGEVKQRLVLSCAPRRGARVGPALPVPEGLSHPVVLVADKPGGGVFAARACVSAADLVCRGGEQRMRGNRDHSARIPAGLAVGDLFHFVAARFAGGE